ncbi:glycerol-3-phosphate 1-O-acyltransferase PlsY [Suttonella sp. R2A3]|uniref:glycerol-3-phosphate 1-O-acyltransferase PlsY n=1 Tax=Suttonella sp. R2A3 TaxID=2908648 RepID=UPI001F157447|nr:glycerol-3-phosphate 1-O-acyltransferase PlsY [Suttonella sp. R2A3]UJF24651.1 glycerol-3-phosphate 1-O-acyltransferase PlsY [Suttonella sp. R2A3]
MSFIIALLAGIFGYLCGSLSSAVIVCKLFGLPDPRTQGSGNPGATNVMRVGGKLPAIITLVGDLLKGLLPVLLVKLLWPEAEMAWLLVGLGAFIGHLWPVFFAFQGGKGVATAIGVLLAWHVWLALSCIAIWLAVFLWTRVSSLSALIAAFCAPWLAFFMMNDKQQPMMVLAMVALLIYRHRENIARLRSGEEAAFKRKS